MCEMWFILTQCAVLGIAFGAQDPPVLPSYNFGITGEPKKVDTAFGNLGEIGPVYDIPPESRKDSTASTRGNPQLGESATTEPPKTVKPTTLVPTGKPKPSNVTRPTTVKTSDGNAITLSRPESVLNYNTTEGAPVESSPIPNPTQSFETSVVSNEQATSTTTQSGENITSSSYYTTVTAEATKSPHASSNPSTQPPSSSSSSTPSSPTSTAQGSVLKTTTARPPSNTFHTGSPNLTDAPTTSPSPENNETTTDQNSTSPSKPNSSLSTYSNNGNIWLTLAIGSFYMLNIKYA